MATLIFTSVCAAGVIYLLWFSKPVDEEEFKKVRKDLKPMATFKPRTLSDLMKEEFDHDRSDATDK